MALTDAQKADVRRFLGYPDVNREWQHVLEGALIVLSPGGETVLGTVLTDLGTIEAQLRTSWGRQKVSKAEDIILAGHDEIMALRREGNRLAEQIATILGVPLRRWPFTSGATSGVMGRG